MLEYLSVKNIALIENIEIEFESGLNVLTGETGAGKSILLDAIGLLLGNRLDKTLIRNGESDCKVIGKFSLNQVSQKKFHDFCQKYDLDKQDEIYISRSHKIDGKSDIRLNGFPITLSMLKELASFMVDSYGQNENQIIFDSSNHLDILDKFSKINDFEPYKEYQNEFANLKEINKQLKQYGGNDTERLSNIDLLSYQISEIENAEIGVDDYNDLLEKRHILLNLGKIISNTMSAQNYLDDNVISNISRAKNGFAQAGIYDEKLLPLSQRLESVQIELEDILESVKDYNSKSDFSESDQQIVEDRLSVYNKLFRKYGNTVENILLNKEEMQNKLLILQNADKEIERLHKEKQILLNKMFENADKISKFRKEKAKLLSSQIVNNLYNLSIKNAKIKFKFTDYENIENNLYFNGADRVELLFSANLGEELKPLNKIASGGEISRFMLALKAVIAESDDMPTMIFDEIDTGISGNTSEAVAKQMAIISKNHQVIVVTHAHQIASMADTNYLIRKGEQGNRTVTTVKKLDNDEKIREIARFLSGDKLTETSIQNAKNMISEQDAYKESI